ncbi:hypothetical protein [Frankia sp. Cr2]|uniref:hypothetical protein n=1 Tax=Frankia sp. Cr2 TaxID=3073932 RepID=UPI002AD570C0|nr:hypothetical protein [Frankia sp. Cr2]
MGTPENPGTTARATDERTDPENTTDLVKDLLRTVEPPLSVQERARLRELEREVHDLRMKAEFLGKAAAFSAQEYQ